MTLFRMEIERTRVYNVCVEAVAYCKKVVFICEVTAYKMVQYNAKLGGIYGKNL